MEGGAGLPAGGRLAVVLFNLGGPDRMESVRPFLLNLFSDPAILRVPFFIRPLLAQIIARKRVKPASENYALIGGSSPLLELTRAQANDLAATLGDYETRCFIAMRYWHPFAAQTAREVAAWRPDHVVLLPLYPQFSTTTTGSSLDDWREAAAAAGLVAPVTSLCCWPTDPAYIGALAELLRAGLRTARAQAPELKLRVLFSAHGLPQVIVQRGDPYQMQIERTAAAVAQALGEPGLDWRVCYQSRATPQKWLDPSTEHEIGVAADDGVGLVVMPIAFVSDHSETLVELDIEYRELAERRGVRGYWRVPAPNSDPGFIAALAGIVRRAVACGPGLCSAQGGRFCAAKHTDCPHR